MQLNLTQMNNNSSVLADIVIGAILVSVGYYLYNNYFIDKGQNDLIPGENTAPHLLNNNGTNQPKPVSVTIVEHKEEKSIFPEGMLQIYDSDIRPAYGTL